MPRAARRRIAALREGIDDDVARMRDALVDAERRIGRVDALIGASRRPPTDAQRAPLLELDSRRVALNDRRVRLQLFCAPADGDERYGIERERGVPEPDPLGCLSHDADAGTWIVSGTGTGTAVHPSRQAALAQIERDRERWHALRVWLERLRADELAALEDVREAAADALAEAQTLAADADALCTPILRVADDERAWQEELEHLDRLQRGRIAADDLLR